MDERPRSIQSLHAEDPIAADRRLLGRVAHANRRGFLRGAGLASLTGLLGMAMPFHRNFPAGLIPQALAQAEVIEGKEGLRILNDRPLNAETPAHLLDDAVTPRARHFIRNNGIPPQEVNAEDWSLRIDGLVERPTTLSIADLKARFEVVTKQLVIECGGNGRAFFDPPASGNQWTYGAVGCSEWTGVRLKDVLESAGIKASAVYTAHEGADGHLSGDPSKAPISRGIPIAKALEPNVLVAFAMNGEPIHPMNGAPLRLVVPGWPGSCSQKWLTRIWLRDRVHDGAKMGPRSYRVPGYPVAPGEEVPDEAFEIIHAMPVKSLITYPRDGVETDAREIELRGHAWAGDRRVREMYVSTDFGASWQTASLDPPANAGAWQRWRRRVRFPMPGYYEVWAKAVDDYGEAQTFSIDWNPKGYLNNWYHRVAVRVT